MIPGHGESAECADLLPDGRRAAVGYGDGSLRIFDLRTGDVERSVSDAAATHTGPVACLAARSEGGAILATGGVDGLTKVLNINTGKNIAAFGCRTNQQREQAEDRFDQGLNGFLIFYTNVPLGAPIF